MTHIIKAVETCSSKRGNILYYPSALASQVILDISLEMNVGGIPEHYFLGCWQMGHYWASEAHSLVIGTGNDSTQYYH